MMGHAQATPEQPQESELQKAFRKLTEYETKVKGLDQDILRRQEEHAKKLEFLNRERSESRRIMGELAQRIQSLTTTYINESRINESPLSDAVKRRSGERASSKFPRLSLEQLEEKMGPVAYKFPGGSNSVRAKVVEWIYGLGPLARVSRADVVDLIKKNVGVHVSAASGNCYTLYLNKRMGWSRIVEKKDSRLQAVFCRPNVPTTFDLATMTPVEKALAARGVFS